MEINSVGILGIIAGIFTSASAVPQAIKTLKTKKTEDISLVMFISLTLGVLLWFFYGIMKNDIPIIAANGFTLIPVITILVCKITYK